ncbi:MAG: hypothetical protein M0Z77_07040 [Thermoplasmatales archaeon]|jgi:hypothetical protein|nr:hypothetical protein [Thermoplasmatales archaeon]
MCGEQFDTLSLNTKEYILKLCREEEKKKTFRKQYVREIEEERDLWQDNFWLISINLLKTSGNL